MPTVCLAMIVRDESDNIERCLRSAMPHVDEIIILDTGSTDGTANLILSIFDEAGFPGRVFFGSWADDFAAARQRVHDLAVRHTDCDYIMSLDADQELRASDAWRDALVDDYHFYVIVQGGLAYPNERILKASLTWQWEGRIHEQPHIPDDRSGRPAAAIARAFGIGGPARGRLEKDVAILDAALEKDPLDEHALFYMGQTLMQLGQTESARPFYEALLDLETPTDRPAVRAMRQRMARQALYSGSS